MDFNLREYAKYFDLRSLQKKAYFGPGDGIWFELSKNREDSSHGLQRTIFETRAAEKLYGSDRLLSELVPLFCFQNGLQIIFEGDVGMRDWWRWSDSVLYRFPTTRRDRDTNARSARSASGVSRLSDRLKHALRKGKSRDCISPELSDLIQAVPQRAPDSANCVRVLREYADWLDDWIGRAAAKINGFPARWEEVDRSKLYELYWKPAREIEAAIAGLIPPAELALKISQIHLGTLAGGVRTKKYYDSLSTNQRLLGMRRCAPPELATTKHKSRSF